MFTSNSMAVAKIINAERYWKREVKNCEELIILKTQPIQGFKMIVVTEICAEIARKQFDKLRNTTSLQKILFC